MCFYCSIPGIEHSAVYLSGQACEAGMFFLGSGVGVFGICSPRILT